jgi:gamma-glutamyltranspeptidase
MMKYRKNCVRALGHSSDNKKERDMIDFDSLDYPYAFQRTVSYAKNGMVATSQSLAAQAGLGILK